MDRTPASEAIAGGPRTPTSEVIARGDRLVKIVLTDVVCQDVRAGLTVVDISLAFAGGDATSQVALNADGEVAGFFIRRADV